jgi:hypothetical protein
MLQSNWCLSEFLVWSEERSYSHLFIFFRFFIPFPRSQENILWSEAKTAPPRPRSTSPPNTALPPPLPQPKFDFVYGFGLIWFMGLI